MVRRSRRSWRTVLGALLLAAGAARAEAPPAAASAPPGAPGDAAGAPGDAPGPQEPLPLRPEAVPVLHHAPVTVTPSGVPLVLGVDLEGPDLVGRAVVVYRTKSGEPFRSVELLRSPGDTTYAAVIPAADVHAPSLEYAIELELDRGGTIAAFASRERPHRVTVPEDPLDLRERALLRRLGGRRSVASAVVEYVGFDTLATDAAARDYYFRVEGAYTYRPLRTVTEFSVKAGVLRGRTPRGESTHEAGMNYAAPSVRFRLLDMLHVDVEALTAVTEIGFELGMGSELFIGDPYGSRLAVGFEAINEFGTRLWSRVDIRATDRVTVSPVIEATNWPHASRFGVRTFLQLAFDLGSGFALGASGGYQAREAASGGPGAALGLSYSF